MESRFDIWKADSWEFMHEYKSLITGKITSGEVPEEKICGVLCILLEQFLDTRLALSFIGDAAGHVDMMTEDYFLDAYLGILPQKDEQEYGSELLTCADELKQTEDALEKAREHMELHGVWLTGLLYDLFSVLFQMKTAAVDFWGNEAAAQKAREWADLTGFMEKLNNAAEKAENMDLTESGNDCGKPVNRIENLIRCMMEN